MLAFFWSRWPNTHAFVRLRMHARAQSRDCLSRVSAPLLRRVIIPSLLHLFRCYVTCDRESTRFSSCYVTIVLFFFSAAHVHTSPVNRQRDVSAFSRPNVGRARVCTQARTRWIFTRYRNFFHSVLPVAILVGLPHILDSAVLISELWARRGNSHSKNGFFRPSGAVMER